jgi:DNA-binding CsgD family transcriptional regulator
MAGPMRNPIDGSSFPPAAWRGIAYALGLAPRELEVLQCLVGDQHEADMAATLGLSRHTVHTHLKRLRAKLGGSSRVQLVKRVYAEYLVWLKKLTPS